MASPKLSLTVYSLDDLIALARRESPFFQRLYTGLPERPALEDLPITEQSSYWEAHLQNPRDVLTGPLHHGIVLNSGGTSGAPKSSYIDYEEWNSAVSLLAKAIDGNGIREGDRVANLFASGYMYSSFVFVMDALKATEARVLQLPIGIFAPPPDAVRMIRAFRGNVWTGLPTHMLGLVDHMEKEGVTDANPRLILFAGESFTADQRTHLENRFPGVLVRSIGYASVDGGMIAYADEGCAPGEHRTFEGATIIEIVDEATGEVIEETARSGRLIFTNLARKLMPTLRYPTGDMGRWVEPAGTRERKFLLMGRSGESVRIGAANLPVSEIAGLLDGFRDQLQIQQFQLLVTQDDLRPTLTLRLVSPAPPQSLEGGGKLIVDTILKQKPLLADLVEKGAINALRISWIDASEIETNPRTGKRLRVIDRRIQ